MNKKLRERAENALLFQEYGVLTDTKTLKGAIIIAHHGKQFQIAPKYLHPEFNTAARMFREKFPQCPCKLCAKASNI